MESRLKLFALDLFEKSTNAGKYTHQSQQNVKDLETSSCSSVFPSKCDVTVRELAISVRKNPIPSIFVEFVREWNSSVIHIGSFVMRLTKGHYPAGTHLKKIPMNGKKVILRLFGVL